MAKDTYSSFNELRSHEELNRDYNIWINDVGSPITIMAPHGGRIEPRTSYIARRIARDQFNCYCFEGIKKGDNGRLHITSHNFDEPQALQLIARSQTVVTVHACTHKNSRVYLGGLDKKLISLMTGQLKAVGIVPAGMTSKYPGLNPENICNRGATQKGAQLEVSRGLRDDLQQIDLLTAAIRAALTELIS
ncbi:MAG: poly-gamma-glutamate hydrolase family protein [Desulfobacterales bacterium]|nr:MAG: poly-gamma-glutamate hydrolase family protein [Desulfobacterales bacterium]